MLNQRSFVRLMLRPALEHAVEQYKIVKAERVTEDGQDGGTMCVAEFYRGGDLVACIGMDALTIVRALQAVATGIVGLRADVSTFAYDNTDDQLVIVAVNRAADMVGLVIPYVVVQDQVIFGDPIAADDDASGVVFMALTAAMNAPPVDVVVNRQFGPGAGGLLTDEELADHFDIVTVLHMRKTLDVVAGLMAEPGSVRAERIMLHAPEAMWPGAS